MADTYLNVKRVAVVGAGVSGVSAVIHLKRAGLDVRGYERTARSGGVWVFDERSAKEPQYPSILPSTGDSPEYKVLATRRRRHRHDSPLRDSGVEVEGKSISTDDEDLALSFAPPGPCYIALKNNVSTTEMKLSCRDWKPATEEFVPHHVLADYIQDAADANGALDRFSFNTRIDKIEKSGSQWKIDSSQLQRYQGDIEVKTTTELFDAVVVATGHYHACKVPNIPNLAQWKQAFPDNVHHSKSYRRPDGFRGKNVLLIGSGVSSLDIAKDLGKVANAVFQTSRGGPFDTPASMLPENAARVEGVAGFGNLESDNLAEDGTIPGVITLTSGRELCRFHHIIICTGYHVSFPFMRQYHQDGVAAIDADEKVLVTDGQHTHNLHKDIWYIPDPTLAFIGVPYHVATFSCFEFQAMALAAVYAGKAPLPSEDKMREEYNVRVAEKGAGRMFHSLRLPGAEIAYVEDLQTLVKQGGVRSQGMMTGHTAQWLEGYERRKAQQAHLRSLTRDAAISERVLSLYPC